MQRVVKRARKREKKVLCRQVIGIPPKNVQLFIFVSFNRLTTTNSIHQGVNYFCTQFSHLKLFSTVAVFLCLSFFFGEIIRKRELVGDGSPHYLGFWQMTVQFFFASQFQCLIPPPALILFPSRSHVTKECLKYI